MAPDELVARHDEAALEAQPDWEGYALVPGPAWLRDGRRRATSARPGFR